MDSIKVEYLALRASGLQHRPLQLARRDALVRLHLQLGQGRPQPLGLILEGCLPGRKVGHLQRRDGFGLARSGRLLPSRFELRLQSAQLVASGLGGSIAPLGRQRQPALLGAAPFLGATPLLGAALFGAGLTAELPELTQGLVSLRLRLEQPLRQPSDRLLDLGTGAGTGSGSGSGPAPGQGQGSGFGLGSGFGVRFRRLLDRHEPLGKLLSALEHILQPTLRRLRPRDRTCL